MSEHARLQFRRDYAPLRASLRALADHASRSDRMRAVCDAIWENLGGDGAGRHVSWIGFYGIGEGEMILLERRDKPACSPIGLHGACGRCWRERRTLIVEDVRTLGEGYVACDPRDMSELVLPCLDEDGSCWGVLDADSFEVGAFDEHDARSLAGVLVAAGLSHREPDAIARL